MYDCSLAYIFSYKGAAEKFYPLASQLMSHFDWVTCKDSYSADIFIHEKKHPRPIDTNCKSRKSEDTRRVR